MADVEAVDDGAAAARMAGQGAPPAAEPDAPAPKPGEMSLVGHLTELRNRIVKVLVAVALGSVVGAIFWEQIRNILLDPLPTQSVQVLGPGDAFVIALRISIITGVILAMPVILWQVWAFVAPGLTDAEKRTVRPWIPLALVFFAIGVGLAYVILPFAVGFLLSFTDDRLVGNLAAGPYFDDDVPRLRADHGVPDHPVRPVPRRDRDLRAAGVVTARRDPHHRRVRRRDHAGWRPREPARPRPHDVRAVRGHDLLHPAIGQVATAGRCHDARGRAGP
jgi:Sec-independent protein translocase protein (TatC)